MKIISQEWINEWTKYNFSAVTDICSKRYPEMEHTFDALSCKVCAILMTLA
jgi:hypothetical protein